MPLVKIDTEAKQHASDLEKSVEKALDVYEKEVEEVKDKPSSVTPVTMGQYVRTIFEESRAARQDTEDRWIVDLRQFRGQYAPEMLERMSPNRSKAFIRLTRNKVKTVNSRLVDFVFPANGDPNWDITPTPLPEISDDALKTLVQIHEQQSGESVTPDTLKVLVSDYATRQASKMARHMEDQLAELKYRETMKEVIHSGNLYGTGVLKGPLVSVNTESKYKKMGDGADKRWVQEAHDVLTPFIESVPLWDFYPDMSATKASSCRYMIQRHSMDKSKLVELSKRADFDNSVISKYLRSNPDGDCEQFSYETELKEMGNRTAGSNSVNSASKKYEVLEFWGYIDMEDVERLGLDVPEKLKGQVEVAANLWTLGDQVIKATLAPLQSIVFPYYFYYYDKDETSFFGEGIASIMRDPQELINSSFRAMLDNAAISAGPQIEANLDLLSEDEDPTEIYPFKVWLRSGDGTDATAPAVRVFTLGSSTAEYLQLNDALEKYADEVTTIPRYMWGDQAGGAGRTASGLSMMMGSANITIKDQVKYFDDGITEPFISALYQWNMEFGGDESIKGDYKVIATGTSSLIAKEVYAQSLMNFANLTNNAVDLPIVKRDKIIRSIAEALDLGDKGLVRSETEVRAQQQQQAEQQKAEQQFMSQMVEVARENGISPKDLTDNMRALYQEQQALQTQAQAVR